MTSLTTPTRRVQRVRHEIHRRTLTVLQVDRPSPSFVRVLPAVARRLAELPSDASVTVLLAAAAADRRALPGPDRLTGLDLRWVDGEQALVDALRALPLPAGEGFAWCAAEAGTAAALRAALAAKGLPKQAMRVAAYWKRGASSFHAELAD